MDISVKSIHSCIEWYQICWYYAMHVWSRTCWMTWGSFSNVTKCHIRRQVVMLLTQSKTWNRHVKCLLSESFLAQILYNYTSVVCVASINPDAFETPSAHGVDETVDALLTNIIPQPQGGRFAAEPGLYEAQCVPQQLGPNCTHSSSMGFRSGKHAGHCMSVMVCCWWDATVMRVLTQKLADEYGILWHLKTTPTSFNMFSTKHA